MNKNSGEICAALVAFLRALYLLHQNHHWQSVGPNFYGNHLLFERIYKDVTDQADTMAEKTIGLFGVEALDIVKQAALIKTIMSKYSDNDLLQASLNAEQEFIKIAENAKNKLEQADDLSMGLDDLIMGLASDAEGRIYLLQQAVV